MIDFDALKTAMGDLDEPTVMGLLEELVKQASSEDAAQAIAACQAGMDIVGAKYETGEYFVAELIFAGDLMAEASACLKPLLATDDSAKAGTMVLCTVKGDIHDIGKNIVKALLEASGVEVIDLGVDVPSDKIIVALQESGANVLAMSGLLTLAIDAMKQTVDDLAAAGLRDTTKVIIGGATVTADYCTMVGADAWTINAAEGVGICRNWLAG